MPEQIDSKGRDASPELPTEVETLRSDAESDFTRSVVPINRRRSQLSMTLVWITGSAAFSTLYAGYALRVGGVGLWDLIIAALVGNIILLIYWWGACYLGARYGQTETLLARSFLGKTGSSLVSIFIVVISLGWFSFQADLFGTAATTLFNIPGALAWVSAGAALVMMTNNLFGFTSVTVWARYVAAPLVTLWVLYVFVKVFATTPSHVLLSRL